MKYDRNPRLVTAQDKLRVKDYAAGLGVDSAKVLFSTTNADEIPFAELPENCFIKANHGCRWNILRFEGNWFHYRHGVEFALARKNGNTDFMTIDERRVRALCAEWLTLRHTRREWAYQEIAPAIFGEEFLHPAHGTEIRDHRFFCFRGKIPVVGIGSPSYRAKRQVLFVSPEWEPIPLSSYKRETYPETIPPKPECLEEMTALAGRLGKAFDFIRVDLYDTTDGIRLGEMTVYPESGRVDSPTTCARFNQWLGDFWELDRTHFVG